MAKMFQTYFFFRLSSKIAMHEYNPLRGILVSVAVYLHM
jgi:hypothetical protein